MLHQLSDLISCLKGQIAYVNHSRRLQPASIFCKSILQSKILPKKIRYVGGIWELASNSFHFVDLISYWYETKLHRIEADELSSNWHLSSTRKGFFDIRGILKAYFMNGIKLEMDWSEDNNHAIWIFEFIDGEVRYNEITGEIFSNDNVLAKIPLLNFSQLGPMLEACLIDDKKLKNYLPSLEEVYTPTLLLLKAFLSHWNSCNKVKSQIIPIS